MTKSIPTVVRELCLFFPQAEETNSHGSPDFRVEGKSFARFCINHHGDGRVALWLHSPPGTQRLYTELNAGAYFVPPYVGPRGWLGVEQQALLTSDRRYSIPKYVGHNGWIDLDVAQHVNWAEIDHLLETSYRHFALKRMLRALDAE